MSTQMSGMAEVLAGHLEFTFDDESQLFRCECGLWMSDEDRPDHLAAALSAAGYGPVAEARAGALEDAADSYSGEDSGGTSNGHVRWWLRARAAAVRGEG